MKPRVALLGLGLMGDPIAARLAAATPGLRVWNRTARRGSGAEAAGAIVCGAAGDAVRDADLIFLCLTDAAAVEDVVFGDDGVAAAISPGALIVDLSTIGPAPTRLIADRAARASGARWIDAPVTGGVAGAKAGKLVILCGGDACDVALAQPLMRSFARAVRHLGPLGAGQAAKLCNQLIVSINVLAIAEALLVCERNGLDPSCLPQALAGGWADSLPLQLLGPRMAEGRAEPRVLAIETLGKDIGLTLASMHEDAGSTPLLQSAHRIFQAIAAAGGDAADIGLLTKAIAACGLERT